MERNEKSMKNISLALAFDYLEEVNYALVQSKMDICNWCIIENNSVVDMENILLEISGSLWKGIFPCLSDWMPANGYAYRISSYK